VGRTPAVAVGRATRSSAAISPVRLHDGHVRTCGLPTCPFTVQLIDNIAGVLPVTIALSCACISASSRKDDWITGASAPPARDAGISECQTEHRHLQQRTLEPITEITPHFWHAGIGVWI
jgi:hypothetical protein